MPVGHNLTYASTLAFAAGGSYGRCKPTLWSPGAIPLETLGISPIPGFQIAFLCIIRRPNFFPFLGPFVPA